MYLQKVISRKNWVKNKLFAGILKVNDENSRIRIQDPDPLVRGMDPRIQIRIHLKMSWIRNTGSNIVPNMCMHRGVRPKVSLRRQDLRLNTRTQNGGSP